jgi:hypothetical protein
MHDIISFLKAAVTRGDSPGVAGCYVVKGGVIYCRSMAMQAGVGMESAVDFNVPAGALDAALSRMKEIQSLTVDDGKVVIRSGRMSSTIRLNPEEPPGLPDMPKKWTKTPVGFAQAVELAKAHIGEMGWSACVRIMDGRVTAFRNASGIDINVVGLKLKNENLITSEVADFLVAQGGSDEYAEQENSICFRWDDGRWMRAQLYNAKMAEANIANIFENAGTLVPVEITQDMKAAYEDAAAMTDKIVMMTAEGFEGRRGEGESRNVIECKIKGVPKDHRSIWDTKYLDVVMAQAKAWNPLTWPAPCYYEGPGFRGVVMGRSRW